jgi:hypothetical protein
MDTEKQAGATATAEEIRAALSNAEWLRYSSGGLIAGGGALIVGMMLGGVELLRPNYAGFCFFYGFFLMADSWFTWHAMLPGDSRRSRSTLMEILSPGALAIYFAVTTAVGHSSLTFPVQAFSIVWWITIITTFGLVILGCQHRMRADRYKRVLKSHEARLVSSNEQPMPRDPAKDP